MTLPTLIDFSGDLAEATTIDPTRVEAGAPIASLDHRYSDPSGQFHSGRWGSTPGRWRIDYSEHEFCHLIEGRVRLTSADGIVREFGAGDAFVIPAGFKGTWETLATCRKHYAIFEANSTSSGAVNPSPTDGE